MELRSLRAGSMFDPVERKHHGERPAVFVQRVEHDEREQIAITESACHRVLALRCAEEEPVANALEFDHRKALTNYQLAVAMRVEGQPKCPTCGEPWPFTWNGCDWCGFPERPGDPISWQDFDAEWSGIETFNIHASCAVGIRWDIENKGEYPMAAYTDSMVTNAYVAHGRGRAHHGWPDESCPLCWNLVHRLPERWEPQ